MTKEGKNFDLHINRLWQQIVRYSSINTKFDGAQRNITKTYNLLCNKREKPKSILLIKGNWLKIRKILHSNEIILQPKIYI